LDLGSGGGGGGRENDSAEVDDRTMHPRKRGGSLPTEKEEPIGARARVDEDAGGEKQGRLAPDGRVERSARAAVATAEKRSDASRAELTIPHRNSLPLCPFLLAATQFY